MNDNLKTMLRDAYELEGLLMLAESRDGEISEILVSAIRDKAESLASNAVMLKATAVVCTAKDEEPADCENDGIEKEISEQQPETENSENRTYPETRDTDIIETSAENENPDGTITEEIPSIEEPETQERITIDEAYIRNKSKDLHNAFSINDMFRFRRELFGNNAAEMTDAINLVDAMADYDEAEDYFYNELGWDKDSEEVIEFMTIIKNHFI